MAVAGPLDADALRRCLRQTDSELAEGLLRLTFSGQIVRTQDGRFRVR